MKVSIIVANTENNAIGFLGKMSWYMPADLKKFKEITLHNYVIMGRKTYESIGYPLVERDNLVISTNPFYNDLKNDKINIFTSVKSSLEYIKRWEDFTGSEQHAFIIGGQQIFENALHDGLVDTIYQTIIHTELPGDTFFEIRDKENWELVEMKKHTADEKNPYDYSFMTWERKSTSLGIDEGG